MSAQVILVFILTFVIHLISTLSYGLRIAGVRTGRIAVSLALFNVLVLVSRTCNTVPGPLLAKHVERSILFPGTANIETELRWLVFASSLATLAGIILIPTFQHLFTNAIHTFGEYRSIPRLLLHSVSFSALREIKNVVSLPKSTKVTALSLRRAPHKILLFNIVSTALLTVGGCASLYAGYLQPELRVTPIIFRPWLTRSQRYCCSFSLTLTCHCLLMTSLAVVKHKRISESAWPYSRVVV